MGFKKCCISIAMDGTDKSLNGSEETVRKIKALNEDGDSNTNW